MQTEHVYTLYQPMGGLQTVRIIDRTATIYVISTARTLSAIDKTNLLKMLNIDPMPMPFARESEFFTLLESMLCPPGN